MVPATPDKKEHTHPHPILAYVYCGQTAGWMKTPFGTEVDLGPGHIVLAGVPALRERGTAAPTLFGPSLLWLNGWMHQDGTWYGGRPQPRRLCVRWGPSPLPKRAQPPNFRPMFVVAIRLDGLRCHLVWRYGMGPGDPATHRKKGHTPPNFWPSYIVAKRLDG